MGDTNTNAKGEAKSPEQRLAELEAGLKVVVQELVGSLRECIEAIESAAGSSGAQRSLPEPLYELPAKLKERVRGICKEHPGSC